MHSFFSSAAIVAMAAFTAATPTPPPQGTPGSANSTLVPRACSVIFPTFIDHIDQANPTTSTNDMNFEVAVDNNAGTFTHRDVLVRFDNIPANAGTCQLVAGFPAGSTITKTGFTQVNAFTLNTLAQSTDTYATAPANAGYFGTITFTSDTNGPTGAVLDSEPCQASLSYRFSIASDDRAGDVSFAETAGQQGVFIAYNC